MITSNFSNRKYLQVRKKILLSPSVIIVVFLLHRTRHEAHTTLAAAHIRYVTSYIRCTTVPKRT